MILAKCLHIFRKDNDVIYGYRLIDAFDQVGDVAPDVLKKAMAEHRIAVTNLRLTSDNRIIGHKLNKKNKKTPNSGIDSEKLYKAFIEKVTKIFANVILENRIVDYGESLSIDTHDTKKDIERKGNINPYNNRTDIYVADMNDILKISQN